MKLDTKWWQIIAVCIVVIGLVVTFLSAYQQDQSMRLDLLTKANISKSLIPINQVESLSGSESDIASPEYQAIKTQLQKIRDSDPEIRFAYLMGQEKDGTIIFYVDSEIPKSKDYSPPGEVFDEASAVVRSLFVNGKNTVEGPISDRWGTWVSGLIPVTDPSTGRVIAVYGIDIDGKNWDWMILQASLPTLITFILFVFLVLLFGFFQNRSNEERNYLKVSEEKYRSLFERSHDIIYTINKEGLFNLVSPSWTLHLGHPVNQVIGKSFREFVHPEDVAKCEAAMYESYNTGKPQMDIEYRVKHADGSWKLHTSNVSPLMDESGTIIGGEGIARDITVQKQVENQLKESESFNRNLVQNLPEYVVIYGLDGKILFVNSAVEQGLGASAETLVGTHVISYIAEEYRDGITEKIKARYTGNDVTTYELDIITLDQRRRSVFVKGIMIQYNGTPAIFLLLIDITERKKAEKELWESENMYRTLTESSTDNIFIIGRDDTITFVNTHAANDLNLLVDEIIGKSRKNFFPPDIADAQGINLQKVFETGEPFHIDDKIQYGNQIIWQDNSLIPLSDKTGNITSILGISRDITKRKQTEEALENSKLRLENIINGTQAGTWEWNVQTGETIFNKQWAEIIGYTLEEISPVSIDTWMNYAHPDDLLISNEILAKHFRRELEWYECETRMKHKSGHWVWVLDRGKVASWTGDGKPLWMFGTHNDITERKSAEEKLKSTLIEKEILLGEVHHRVKNSLTGMIGLINLRINLYTDPFLISILKNIEAQIRSMIIVHELLCQTKDFAGISPATYVEELIQYRAQTYEKPTEVSFSIDMGEFVIPIEIANPLGLVMNEIVTNALKYAFPKSFSCKEIRGNPCTISFSMKSEGNDYLLKISDNGIGIADGTDFSMTCSIGLYLIRFIVEHQLQGNLEISTTGGTSYTIRFPMQVS